MFEVLLLIVSVIIVIIKKGTRKVFFDEDALFLKLPSWINDAEEKFGAGNGDQKLEYVARTALKYIADSKHVEITDIPGSLILTVISLIEDVLSTPTKKKEIESEREIV